MNKCFFSNQKLNIQTNYWSCYNIRRSTAFCKSFFLFITRANGFYLLRQQLVKESKKDLHKKGKDTCK